MIGNISIWEELLLEMERPGRMLKWIYVPRHAGLEVNDKAGLFWDKKWVKNGSK